MTDHTLVFLYRGIAIFWVVLPHKGRTWYQTYWEVNQRWQQSRLCGSLEIATGIAERRINEQLAHRPFATDHRPPTTEKPNIPELG